MLLQSQSGEVVLLPALPKAWAQGSVKGLCARGGFVVDMEWDAGKLTSCRVLSKNGGTCTIRYNGEKAYPQNEKRRGMATILRNFSQNRITGHGVLKKFRFKQNPWFSCTLAGTAVFRCCFGLVDKITLQSFTYFYRQ
jgi:hypothetical protein